MNVHIFHFSMLLFFPKAFTCFFSFLRSPQRQLGLSSVPPSPPPPSSSPPSSISTSPVPSDPPSHPSTTIPHQGSISLPVLIRDNSSKSSKGRLHQPILQTRRRNRRRRRGGRRSSLFRPTTKMTTKMTTTTKMGISLGQETMALSMAATRRNKTEAASLAAVTTMATTTTMAKRTTRTRRTTRMTTTTARKPTISPLELEWQKRSTPILDLHPKIRGKTGG